MLRDIKTKRKRIDTQHRLGLRPRSPAANVQSAASLTTLAVVCCSLSASLLHKGSKTLVLLGRQQLILILKLKKSHFC